MLAAPALDRGRPLMPDTSTPVNSAADEAILTRLREFYDYDVQNWAAIRAEAAIDVAYAANDGWTEADKADRAGRPMLNLDQLSQYLNQLENTVRQNKRAIKASPSGRGATTATAEHRSNRIREIEYESHAQEAYIQAFSDCAMRSYGFARIIAEYEDEDTANQTLRIVAIANPNQVVPDSDAQSTSGRDWTRCFFLDSLSHAEFKRDYPDAKFTDFDSATITRAGSWITATRVQVAEFWELTETPNPRGFGRPTRTVCMYLTNGLELLAKRGQPKKHPWKGKYIPFGSCYGKILYRDHGSGESTKTMLSYTRFARDGAKGYNWTKSTLLEKIALPVKASLIGYEGQADSETLKDIERATKEHVAWIGFKPMLDVTGQAVLPLPQYGTREPDIQPDLVAAEGFQRDIQNALGRYSASNQRLGDTKVTSGVALRELDKSGDLGSYHFIDHYDDFLKFFGEQLDDLLTHYDDAEREVATRLPDGTPKQAWVNRPTQVQSDGTKTYGPEDLPMSVGRHTITISTGPSFDSQRDAAKETVLALMGNQQLAPVVAARGVRMLDLGPDGDALADDLEFVQPPAMQEARQREKAQDGQPADPQILQQQLDQLKQQLQQAEQVMEQMQGELQGKQGEIASKEKIAQAELTSADQNAEADRQLKAQQTETAESLKLTIAERELALKEAALELERQMLQLKADELEAKLLMHEQDLASKAQIAEADRQAARASADTAARAKRSVKFTRGPDGSVQSAVIGDHGDGAPS
jgi:hypothetical protein